MGAITLGRLGIRGRGRTKVRRKKRRRPSWQWLVAVMLVAVHLLGLFAYAVAIMLGQFDLVEWRQVARGLLVLLALWRQARQRRPVSWLEVLGREPMKRRDVFESACMFASVGLMLTGGD